MIKTEIKEFPLLYVRQHSRAIVGWGSHKMAGEECKAYGIKHALLVSTGIEGTGIIEEVKGVLEYAGIAISVFDGITSNPKDKEIFVAYKAYKDAGCNGIVSVGGGSSHDAGKAVRLLATNEGEKTNLKNFACFLDPESKMKVSTFKPITIPHVAINTTSGTGADCTGSTIVTDSDWIYKMIIVVPGIAPSVGISDPLLMRTQPEHIAAWTGMDALIHAIEPTIGRLNFPVAQAVGLRVIKLISENLREVVANRNNDVALENMAWAQFMAAMGYNMGGGMGMAHGIGHMISAIKDVHHGRINSIMLVPIERFNMIAKPKMFAEIANCFGVDTRGMTTIQAAEKAIDEIERLRNDVGITNISLKQFDFTEKDIDHVAKWVIKDLNCEANPRDINQSQVKEILRSLSI
jgi:alcohol dehydrogenase class IV